MRSWTDAVRGLLGVMLVAACTACSRGREGEPEGGANAVGPAAIPAASAGSNAPIQNLRIPLEVWEDGKVKTQVVAASAQMPEEGGDVVASQIRIEMYRQNGDLENLVMAENCRYNREKGVATSDANVHVERDGALMTGQGFEWNGSNEVVRIKSNVKVVLQRSLRWDMAVQPGKEREVA